MGATPTYGLPYPEPGAQATVPEDIKRLATTIEALLVQRAGQYLQDFSLQYGMQCSAGAGSTQGAWTERPTNAPTDFPLEVTVRNPPSARLAVTIGCYMGTDDVGAYGEMGFRVYLGPSILADTDNVRTILYNGTPGVKATCQRTFVVDIGAAAAPGSLLTVRAVFRNKGTKGNVDFSYPSITVNTRTSDG